MIFDTMSVYESIVYYALIKGIPFSKVSKVVENAMDQLDLQKYKNTPTGKLSGGNQRKVCVAQALVGSPQVILLDEPAAGMDPEACRFMWDVVGEISKKGVSAIVLTTHSMQEAEALSTKMGIMVQGGVFRCLGTSQHIKNKYGKGFVIDIKYNPVPQEQSLQASDTLSQKMTEKLLAKLEQ